MNDDRIDQMMLTDISQDTETSISHDKKKRCLIKNANHDTPDLTEWNQLNLFIFILF